MPFVHCSGSENIGKYLIPKHLWAPKGALETWESIKKPNSGSVSTKQIPPSQAILEFMDPAAQNLSRQKIHESGRKGGKEKG